jgi:hypothetical protein
METPSKIILSGDKDCARNFMGAAQSQLRILKNEMKFQDLEQGARQTRLNEKVIVNNTINHGIETVEIYCEPEEKPEEEKEEEGQIVGRFFARVRRGGLYRESGDVKSYDEVVDYEYYWIHIKREKGKFKIGTTLVESGDKNRYGISLKLTLWALTNLPLHMAHAATKSFMLDKTTGEGKSVFERWVATQHALTIDRAIVFYPLYFAFHGLDFIYPYPPAMGGDGKGGFTHPVPPSRFYCDTGKCMMAWYSVKTIPDPYFPDTLPPISYVFGLLLRIENGFLSAKKTFNCYSSEVDTEGFDPLWFYKGTIDIPLPYFPEIPAEMVSDVNCIGNEELEVTIPWNHRPIKYRVDLTGPLYATVEDDHTYEAIESCDHWYWTKEGFEQRLSGEFGQLDKGGAIENDTISGTGPGSVCAGGSEAACCPGCGGTNTGNVNNKLWSTSQTINRSSTDKESWANIYIFEEIESMRSARIINRQIGEIRAFTAEYCFWDAGPEECKGPYAYDFSEKRKLGEEAKQKIVDGAEAEWSNSNVAFVGSEIARQFADNESWQMPENAGGWANDCANAPDCFDLCPNLTHLGDCADVEISGGAKCFYGYPFPGIEWADAPVNDHFQQYTDGCCWTKSQDIDDFSQPLTLQYRVDGEGYFPSQLFNRTYYLDDRSTDDSEGLLAAARGARDITDRIKELEAIPEEDRTPAQQKELKDLQDLDAANFWKYPIFEVSRWSVIYKADDEAFEEITDQLLEALGCDKTELIELGLI